MKRPEPKFKRGQKVSISNVEVDNPKYHARIANTRWDKEYKNWEYTTPPFAGWQLEFSLRSVGELSPITDRK